MGWATADQVLKHHRMLTRWQALIRQSALSAAIGAMLGLTYFLSGALFYVLLFSSVFVISFYLLDTLCPSGKYQSFLKRYRLQKQCADSDNGETPYFLDVDRNRKRSLFVRLLLSSEGVLLTETLVSVLSSFLILSFLSGMPDWLLIIQAYVINTGMVYLICISLLAHIERMELDEFSTNWRHKAMLRFLKTFAYSRNYFFLGKVAGKRIGLPRMLRFLHCMIGAPTGEGKSSSLIIPPLLFDADGIGSAVVPDAKSPELFNWVAGRWLKFGKRVFLFDPWHPDTVGINPLPKADDQDLLTIVEVIMREREEILKEDAFFRSRTKYLLFAILKLAQSFDERYCNMASVYHIVQSVDTLKNFIETAPDVIKKLFADFDDLYAETRVNALTSIREKMDVFMEADVRKAFSKSEFELSMLFYEKEPCLLILGCPIDKKEPGTKIASLLVNLIVNIAFRERRMQKQAFQRGEHSQNPNDLYLYLDELRNLKITALADLISIARETRTHVIDSVTDIMFFKYYKEDFSSLMGNHRTRIFMRGLDYDSAKYVSDSLGKHDVATYKYFRGLMASQEQRNLLDADKVMNLPEDKLIIFSPKTNPFVADKVSIYRTRWLMKMRIPPPRQMKELYEQWEVRSEPLTDTAFPVVEGSDDFDFSKIKGSKSEAELTTKVNPGTFNREARGGGKYVRDPEKTSEEPDDSVRTQQQHDSDEMGMVQGSDI